MRAEKSFITAVHFTCTNNPFVANIVATSEEKTQACAFARHNTITSGKYEKRDHLGANTPGKCVIKQLTAAEPGNRAARVMITVNTIATESRFATLNSYNIGKSSGRNILYFAHLQNIFAVSLRDRASEQFAQLLSHRFETFRFHWDRLCYIHLVRLRSPFALLG